MRTAQSQTATEASTGHTSPFKPNGEVTLQETSLPPRRKYVQSSKATRVLTQNMYPLLYQALHPRRKSSPEESNFRTQKQHPDTRNKNCQKQGHEEIMYRFQERTARAHRTGNSFKSNRRLTHNEGLSLPEAAMVTVWRVDQREHALASITLATGPREAASPMPFSMPIIPGHPRKLLGPSRASTSVQRATTSTCRQTHPPRTGRNELPAWMGSTRGAVPTPSADQSSHFFSALKRFPSSFMRKRCETRILEMRATMRNWNVNELLRTRC